MIKVCYLCDPEANTSCRKTSCAASARDNCYCEHTHDRDFSKHFKDHEPTNEELSMFFEVVAGSNGYEWWEVNK